MSEGIVLCFDCTITPSYHYQGEPNERMDETERWLNQHGHTQERVRSDCVHSSRVSHRSMRDQIILVNENNEMVGVGEKLTVHRKGLLHRAFSIFILNSHGELLLQRRALTKYHSAGLWSNTCCGHPRPGEQIIIAAQRRLKTEMGLNCRLKEIGGFIYRAEVGDDLIEHEFDHVFIGYSDLDPTLNLEEAIGWKRSNFAALTRELSRHPSRFTFWLKVIMDTQLHKFPISSGGHFANLT